MNILPMINIYTDEKQQAEFYFNREFDSVLYTDFEDWYEVAEVVYPSDEVLRDEFISDVPSYNIDIDEELQEYNEENDIEDTEDSEEFKTWLIDKYEDEFDTWKYENESLSNNLMWSWVFKCEDVYESKVDELYNIGISLINYKDSYYLGINGCGYDFYEGHWIPLFRDVLKWIKTYDNYEDLENRVNSAIESLQSLLSKKHFEKELKNNLHDSN